MLGEGVDLPKACPSFALFGLRLEVSRVEPRLVAAGHAALHVCVILDNWMVSSPERVFCVGLRWPDHNTLVSHYECNKRDD